MAVDLQASIDRTKIDSLPFLGGVYPFGYVNSKYENRLGVVYEIGVDDCRKITSLFKGKQEKILAKGDKVFVLSGCKIPQFKIKDYLRGIGATMVSDIEDATVFVGNSRVFQIHGTYDANPLDSLSMIMEIAYCNATRIEEDSSSTITADPVIKDYADGVNNARFTRLLASRNTNYETGGIRIMHCITPYTARVCYEILSRGVVTINEECLFKQLPTAAVLDKQLFTQVCSMLASPDLANHKLAHEVLANCDYSDSDFFLYQLAKKYYYNISDSRYKNVRLFVTESNLQKYYSYTEVDFLNHLTIKNKLTVEALNLLLPGITSAAYSDVKTNRSSIFKIKLELREDLAALLGDHDYNKEIEPTPLTDEQNN